MMPLTMAPAGEAHTIVKINGKDEVRQHLNELGFVPDAVGTIVNEIGGNMIISLKSSRVALDKTMTNRIMVEQGGYSHENIEGYTHRSEWHGHEAPRRGGSEAPHHGHGRHQEY